MVHESTYTVTCDQPEDEECPCVEIIVRVFIICMLASAALFCTEDGIRDASRRHDAMARRKYVKPFKWFKFNRARKATAK